MSKKAPRVGITIDNFKGLTPAQLLTITSKFGVRFVELTESVFDDLESVKKAVAEMETGFHLPNLHDFGYDFSHREKHEHIQNLIKKINKNYRDLNIQYCLSHPPEENGEFQPTDEQVGYLLSNLKQLQPPLVIENTQFMSPDQFEKFYRQAQEVLGDKLVGKCFDASHYFLSGNDPLKFLSEMDSDVFCMHLSDCKNDMDAHLPFGLGGQLPIDEILNQVKRKDFSGFINLELMPRKISDVRPLIESYLMVTKKFSYFQYLRSKMKLLLQYPALKRMLQKAFQK